MNIVFDSSNISLLTIINLVFAAINVLFAAMLTIETKKLREIETDPEISIYLERNEVIESVYDIIVKNIGKGPAYKITFDFDHNSVLIQQNEFRKLHELGYFQGVEYMAPNQEYRTMFGGHELFREPPYERLLIKVNYKRKDGRNFKNLYYIDPANYWGTVYMGKKSLTQIHDRLKEIKDEINNVSSNLTNLK